MAQGNGAINRVLERLLSAVGSRRGILPFLFYLAATVVASMGSAQAGYVLMPIAMPAARRSGIDPMLMAVAINSGIATGGFAPTSLFGIVTNGTARQAGIGLNPFVLLAAAALSNVALLTAAHWLFPGTEARQTTAPSAPETKLGRERLTTEHIVMQACIAGLILSVMVSVWRGIEPDIGILAFAFAAIVTLVYPATGADAVRRIDWSTVLMIGGIITFVGVLQRMDAVNLLGHAAMNVGTPIVAAFVICLTAGLVSAFASTTGILAALVPLAVPLATSGGVPGWALICAIGVCASIVDASPFSTTGAMVIASAAEDERARLKSLLTR